MRASASGVEFKISFPDSRVQGANMGPIWGRQDPCGPHVGPINFAIWVIVNITQTAKLLTNFNNIFYVIIRAA